MRGDSLGKCWIVVTEFVCQSFSSALLADKGIKGYFCRVDIIYLFICLFIYLIYIHFDESRNDIIKYPHTFAALYLYMYCEDTYRSYFYHIQTVAGSEVFGCSQDLVTNMRL